MKTSNIIISIAMVLLTITSCGPGFFEHGNVSPDAYDQTIPFENRQGLIVVQLNVEGTDYDFLFDSGAITIVSKEVASTMELETEFSSTFTDSQDKPVTIDFGHSSKLKIGDVSFDNLGIGVADFTTINSISCLNIDGIIGSNLMQKAIWNIDSERNELRLTNDINNFNLDTNARKIKFSTNDKGEPRIDLKINGIVEEGVEIDFGSTGGFNLDYNTLEKISDEKQLDKIDGFGFKSAGFTGYGDNTQTTTFVMSDQITIDGTGFNSQMVSFNENTITNIGNDFLSHFNIVMDWSDKNLYLTEISSPKSIISNFGFKPIFKNDRPIVGFIYQIENSELSDLLISDEITSINGINTGGVSIEEWCNILDEIESTDSELQISLNRDGQNIDKVLPKISLL